jgi:hypothetical protein
MNQNQHDDGEALKRGKKSPHLISSSLKKGHATAIET